MRRAVVQQDALAMTDAAVHVFAAFLHLAFGPEMVVEASHQLSPVRHNELFMDMVEGMVAARGGGVIACVLFCCGSQDFPLR